MFRVNTEMLNDPLSEARLRKRMLVGDKHARISVLVANHFYRVEVLLALHLLSNRDLKVDHFVVAVAKTAHFTHEIPTVEKKQIKKGIFLKGQFTQMKPYCIWSKNAYAKNVMRLM
ncbi:hypothetical protein TURU_156200 [Turdus rufiventris]|nr:hypothetical protein TURU_156200 [Turdus rufiventris]